MENSTKVIIGLGVVVGVAAIAAYVHNEHMSAEAKSAEQELERRKEERFLMSIVKNYRLDHALRHGTRENIDYVLLDTIVDRELKMAQLVDRKTPYRNPVIKAQATHAQLVGRFGVRVELTTLKLDKS